MDLTENVDWIYRFPPKNHWQKAAIPAACVIWIAILLSQFNNRFVFAKKGELPKQNILFQKFFSYANNIEVRRLRTLSLFSYLRNILPT
jgi:hypothetical protein